jgi:mono/diheme cytochrome c family protein
VRAHGALWLALLLASGCYHFAQLAPRRAEAAAPPLYVERCSTCHGEAGRGDGFAGRSLEPRPRDFADARWQDATSDERIRLVIRQGGAAAGLSALMAPHTDLSDDELAALVAYIRLVGAR